MSDLHVPRGDYGYPLGFTVKDYDGVAVDLTGYTVKLKQWYMGASTNPLLTGTCAVDSAPNGQCHYTVTNTDFIKAGEFLIEIELTKTGAVESTAYYTLIVEESA